MKTPCCNNEWLEWIDMQGTVIQYSCKPCGKVYSPSLHDELATAEGIAEPLAIPGFNHEERCSAAFGLALKEGYPKPPADDQNEAQISKAKAEIKRWISRNYKDWPCCRHSQHPIPLEFWHQEIGKGWDGMILRAQFKCDPCARR